MNPDYIIGSKQPHILFADYAGDTSNLKPAAYRSGAVADTKADTKTASAAANKNPSSDDHELSFDDFIDIINPLQHIPVVNYIYRAITGDKISGFADVAGGALFGGPMGLVGGVISAIFNDETGHGPAETMVADVLGIEDHATMVASADRSPKPVIDENTSLDTQLASAMPQGGTEGADKNLDTQIASAMPKAQTLDNQMAAAMLPPVGPSSVQVAAAKQPYGGVMDMGLVNNARKGPPTLDDAGTAQLAAADEDEPPLAAAIPANTPHAQEVAEGQKFYSLAKVKRLSPGTQVAIPIHGGPDVRLKPISRQAVNKPPAAIAIPADNDAEARRILGLPDAGAPVAALDGDPTGNITPDQADLMPAYGIKSQAVPSALIEDMMKMGLDKYQKGLSNGTLGAPPAIDVRG